MPSPLDALLQMAKHRLSYSDHMRPRPLFMMTGRVLAGLREIESYIASLAL